MFKKVIAGALSTVICCSTILSDGFSGLKAATPSAPPSTALQDESDVRLEGSNSLSSYLAESATAHNTNASANFPVSAATEETFSIGNMGFDPESGEIVLSTTQTSVCKAVIEFIDESTGKTALTVETKLQKGESVMTLARADVSKLPAYYTIAARLENVRGELLSNVFRITKYTEAVQEIIATDIHDFEEEKVVNLDESEETNFLVLNEETVLAETTETENILLSADYDNNVYVFDGISKDLRGLQRNDYFYIQPTAEDIIAIQVEDVTIDGDCATISGNNDIDDMFDFIKIDTNTATDVTTEDAVLADADESDEAADTELSAKDALCDAIETQGLSEQEKQERESELPFKLSVEDGTVKLNFWVKSKEDLTQELFSKFVADRTSMDITSKLEGELAVKPNLYFYKSLTYSTAELILDCHMEISLSASYAHTAETDLYTLKNLKTESVRDGIEYSDAFTYDALHKKRICSAFISTPITGLGINFELDFVYQFKGELDITVSKDFKKGMKYDTDENTFTPITDDTSVINMDGSIKGSFMAGFDIKVGSSFLKIMDVMFVFRPMYNLTAEAAVECEKYAYVGNDYVNLNMLTNDFTENQKLAYMNVFYNPAKEKSLSYCDAHASFDVNPSLYVGLEATINLVIFKKTWEHEFTTVKADLPVRGVLCFNQENGLTGTWGETDCPHQAYRVDFQINVTSDSKVVNPNTLVLRVDDLDFPIHEEAFYAQPYRFHLYCKPEKAHFYRLFWDDKQIASGSFTMESAKVLEKQEKTKSVEIQLSQHVAEDGTVSFDTPTVQISIIDAITTTPATTAPVTTTVTTTTTTRPLAQQIIERKQLSEQDFFSHDQPFDSNIAGYLYGDHHLVIAGYGRMKDFGSCPFDHPEDIYSVEFLDTDPENGLYIENIGAHLFDGCTNLTSLYSDNEGKVEGQQISFPSTMSEIGDFAFARCMGIRQITLPKSIKTLGSCIFDSCSGLTEAVVEDGIQKIGAFIFRNCESIESLTIPFDVLPSYSKLDQNPDAVRTHAIIAAYVQSPNIDTSKRTAVDIPPWLGLYSDPNGNSTSIACYPTSLKKITVTSGTEILRDTFYGMDFLEEVILPDTIQTIGKSAFKNCTNLNKLSFDGKLFPSQLETIEANAFSNCKAIEWGDIVFPKTLSFIGETAFANCDGIDSVMIPSNVKTLDERIFESCLNLTEATVADGVEKIGAFIFRNCGSIASLTIPFDVVPSYSKEDQNPDAVRTHAIIAAYVQSPDIDTSMRTAVYIPAWLGPYSDSYGNNTSIAYYPTSLKKITVTSGTEILKDTFNGMECLEEVILPDTIKTIGDSAFSGCTGLTAFNVEHSEDEWSKVTIGSGNDVLETVTINYNYEIPETEVPETHLYGDVDGDGKVKIFDAVLLCQYIAEIPCNISSEGLICADSTHDGLVTMDDVTQILKIIARLV